jgi:hypothetical protein
MKGTFTYAICKSDFPVRFPTLVTENTIDFLVLYDQTFTVVINYIP